MHPTIKLIYLLVLAIIINIVSDGSLFFIASILLLMLIYYRVSGMVKVLFRLKWLFLSLVLVYAFNTPGEYLQQWPFALSPTFEGLREGGMQVLRISLMMAGLTLLTALTNRQQIMAGLYMMLRPCEMFGVSVERFTARLWLTLHYVEHRQQCGTQMSIFQVLKSTPAAQIPSLIMSETIELNLPILKWQDVFFLCIFVLLIYLVDSWVR